MSGYAEALGEPYGSPNMHPISPHFNAGHYDEEINSSDGDHEIHSLDRKQTKQIQDRTFKLS